MTTTDTAPSASAVSTGIGSEPQTMRVRAWTRERSSAISAFIGDGYYALVCDRNALTPLSLEPNTDPEKGKAQADRAATTKRWPPLKLWRLFPACVSKLDFGILESRGKLGVTLEFTLPDDAGKRSLFLEVRGWEDGHRLLLGLQRSLLDSPLGHTQTTINHLLLATRWLENLERVQSQTDDQAEARTYLGSEPFLRCWLPAAVGFSRKLVPIAIAWDEQTKQLRIAASTTGNYLKYLREKWNGWVAAPLVLLQWIGHNITFRGSSLFFLGGFLFYFGLRIWAGQSASGSNLRYFQKHPYIELNPGDVSDVAVVGQSVHFTVRGRVWGQDKPRRLRLAGDDEWTLDRLVGIVEELQ